MSESILTSTKKSLNIAADDTSFDADIIMSINSVFAVLNQLGVGPVEGFTIEDAEPTWFEFYGDDSNYNHIRSYMYIRVKLLFDPPSTSFLLAAVEKQIAELEWRIATKRDVDLGPIPTPSYSSGGSSGSNPNSDIVTYTPVPGPKGDPGEQGPQGIDGLPGTTLITGYGSPDEILPNAIPGDLYLDLQDANLYGPLVPETGWGNPISLIGPLGPKGDKGDKGDTGTTGSTGAAGSQGIQGAAGENGATGPEGPTGAKGDKGDTGSTGPTGATGSQGAQGVRGLTGSQGPSGPQGDNGLRGVQGDKGDKGDTGPTGAQGSAGATGATGAKGDKGDKGDTGDTGPAGDAGPTGATGSAGSDGSDGATGATGSAGADGRTVWNGSGVPSSGLGANGDFYIDTTAHSIYGPKASGAWGSSTALVGPTGATGSTGSQGIQGTTGATGSTGSAGANGSTVLNGSGVPSGGTGANGDFYINTTANTIYGPKTGGSWGSATSLVGPTGATGSTGSTGPTGSTGSAGSTGATGPTGPAGAGTSAPRVTSITTSSTPTPDISTTDHYYVTALGAAATFGAPTGGTPNDGQHLLIRIKDNATARALSWNAIYVSGPGTLLTTTVVNKTHLVSFIYDAALTKWVCVAAEAGGH